MMNLKTAIELLQELIDTATTSSSPHYIEAIKLGTEALKARKVWQDNEGFDPAEALPGETE